MPIDLWLRARDEDHRKQADKELAEFGELQCYESVFDDLYPPRDEILEETQIDEIIDWLNRVQKESGRETGNHGPKFLSPLDSSQTRAIAVLGFALRSYDDSTTIEFAAEAACLIGSSAIRWLFRGVERSPTHRRKLIQVIGRIEGVDFSRLPVSTLVYCLDTDNSDVRVAALGALRGQEQKAVSVLTLDLKSNNQSRRLTAIRLLCDFLDHLDSDTLAELSDLSESHLQDEWKEARRTLRLLRQHTQTSRTADPNRSHTKEHISAKPRTENRKRSKRGRRSRHRKRP